LQFFREEIVATTKGFNNGAFYRALARTVDEKDLTWKEVSKSTGVSASTLTRMAQGKKPDASSLAALSAWASLNPASFVEGVGPIEQPQVSDLVQEVSTLLRSHNDLSGDAKDALENIFKVAYDQFKLK
jgi:transcriptional regulator with XRE-family HTH domain